MTLSELKQAIAGSPNKEWYQNYSLEVNYPHIAYKNTLNGLVNIYQFVIEQAEGYSTISNLPTELDRIRVRFIGAKGHILNLFSQNNTTKSYWDEFLSEISGKRGSAIFLYGSAETDFLLHANQQSPELFDGALDYLSGESFNSSNKSYFEGYLLAYEFSSKDLSAIATRKEKEKKSITKIAVDFSNQLGEAQKEAIEIISQTHQKFEQYSESIDILKNQKKETFDGWFQETSKKFEEFTASSAKAIKSFEDLYTEKLKLEAPAQYWNKRAGKLRKEGKNWLIGMIICLLLSTGVLILILDMIASGTLQQIFTKTSTAIKWSVAFVVLISFLAYGIRTFAKLTFSSFHLVRDAEEREQLTYVYLALKKEKDIDPTERHLIMQSLFSRADSGLLKDDSGPTMPGQIFDQIAKK